MPLPTFKHLSRSRFVLETKSNHKMRKAVSALQDFSDNDVVQFCLRPQVIARTLAGVFSLTIFASLVNEGYQNLITSSKLHCVLNDNGAACCYGITVGVLSFFQCLLFLGFDFYATVTSYKFKYAILVLDVTFSIIWTGLWFVGFCFLANQWNQSTHHYLLGTSAARASITFALFSIPCWVYLAYLALKNLWAEPPIPYKRTLDEGSVALTTFSSSAATSFPNNVGNTENVGTASFPSTPVPNRLTLMNTDN